jgi:hypothetical protein
MLIVPLHKKRTSEFEAHARLPCSPSHRIRLGNTMHLIGGWTAGLLPLLLPTCPCRSGEVTRQFDGLHDHNLNLASEYANEGREKRAGLPVLCFVSAFLDFLFYQ